jgi:hypothetical protein
MANEMAKWSFIGMIIGVIVFSILLGYVFFSAPSYTPEEKEQINNAYAANCSKCLVQENISCTPDELEYTHWGPICKRDYISKNCTQCRRV